MSVAATPTCVNCGAERPRGRRIYCDECGVLDLHHRNQRYRDYRRDWDLRHRYGITLEQYDAAAQAQGGVCVLCGQPQVRDLCVDHDHATGENRGLLCHRCNSGLGYLEDPTWLAAAMAYLANPPGLKETP